MKEITIGLQKDMTDIPAEVRIDRDFYYLLKDGQTYRLVSRYCPHAGALVEAEDGELVCYMHGWSFDALTGACLNVPGKQLACFPVIVRNGELIAQFEM